MFRGFNGCYICKYEKMLRYSFVTKGHVYTTPATEVCIANSFQSQAILIWYH